MRRPFRSLLLLPPLIAPLAVTGCSLTALLKDNTRTVGESTAGIAANTRVVEHSTAVTEQLLPAMEGLGNLRQPMVAVAGLGPSLASVAALETPMSRLAALDAPMREVGALSPQMRA